MQGRVSPLIRRYEPKTIRNMRLLESRKVPVANDRPLSKTKKTNNKQK